MLRICLILCLLAGLAGLGVSHFMVRPKIETLQTDLQTTSDNLTQAQQAERTAKQESQKAIAEAEASKKEATELKDERDRLSVTAAEQRKRADGLEDKLATTTEERNRFQSELSAWNALGISVDRIRQLQVDLRKSQESVEALKEENTVIDRKNRILQADLDRYVGKNTDVPLPAGLKGRVLEVNRDYDFVVLDIGENQGVLRRGKMMVSREGKLVAKVEIVRVESDRSVANILADWKQADVVAGDLVMY